MRFFSFSGHDLFSVITVAAFIPVPIVDPFPVCSKLQLFDSSCIAECRVIDDHCTWNEDAHEHEVRNDDGACEKSETFDGGNGGSEVREQRHRRCERGYENGTDAAIKYPAHTICQRRPGRQKHKALSPCIDEIENIVAAYPHH